MYTRVRPQVAQHSSGYRVEVRSRQRVALIESDGTEVTAEIEFGPTSTIYRGSLAKTTPSGQAAAITESEAESAADRICSALHFLGGKYEIA